METDKKLVEDVLEVICEKDAGEFEVLDASPTVWYTTHLAGFRVELRDAVGRKMDKPDRWLSLTAEKEGEAPLRAYAEMQDENTELYEAMKPAYDRLRKKLIERQKPDYDRLRRKLIGNTKR